MYIICWKVQKDIFIDHIFMFLCVSEVTLKCVCKMWIPFSYITLQYVITDHKAFYFLFLRLGGGEVCSNATWWQETTSLEVGGMKSISPRSYADLRAIPSARVRFIRGMNIKPTLQINKWGPQSLQNSARLISNMSQLYKIQQG